MSLDGIVLRPLSSTLYPIVYRLEIQWNNRSLPEFLIDGPIPVSEFQFSRQERGVFQATDFSIVKVEIDLDMTRLNWALKDTMDSRWPFNIQKSILRMQNIRHYPANRHLKGYNLATNNAADALTHG